ncbi:hypothetical protein OG562_10670 [Streptomyces sp. NBC_01275]|uniref:hypothetical protein n=1 Tax=Streptomyces sp. NBC_01275 TaxID=2903807 RepID=UPI002256C410|nr:hypothetical protein [Streptomyces sp. NBC_01275]MCX4761435.1 hypothetical protein [Streptomyces sp. NBC_01275]
MPGVRVRVDLGRGAAAARRLAEGTVLRDVVDVGAPASWLELDEGVRSSEWSYSLHVPTAWEQSEGGQALAAALRSGEPLTESQLALALCHRDGRIRGAVLGRVADRPDLLPLLVLRCADWAEPVRRRARGQLSELLDAGRAVALLPLILRIERRRRAGFVTELADGLLREAPRDVLTPLYTDPDRVVRRFAHRLAVERGLLSPVELARVAAREEDAVVQTLCAEAAVAAITEGDPYDGVLEPLLGARSPRVRSVGVTALRRAGRAAEAVGFLADRSGLVRACARYAVRQRGIDPLPWYRERCADPGDPALPPGAAVGLAECGGRADAEALWALLAHPVPRVRAQAVAGLRVLDTADARRLWPLLDDPAPGVVREVLLAVLPSPALARWEWLAERLRAERPRHVRVAAFRLALEQGGSVLEQAAVVLRDDPDPLVRERAARVAVPGPRRRP